VKRRRGGNVVVPLNLREVYQLQGEFSVKMIIDPDESIKIDRVEVSIRDSDGNPMQFTYRRWGTKLNITFKIDEATPDGVAIIDVEMSGRLWGPIRERFDMWVVK
jgi:hypothetical protein